MRREELYTSIESGIDHWSALVTVLQRDLASYGSLDELMQSFKVENNVQQFTASSVVIKIPMAYEIL